MRGGFVRFFLRCRISVRIGLRLLDLTLVYISCQTLQTSPYILRRHASPPGRGCPDLQLQSRKFTYSPTLLRSPVQTWTVSKSTRFLSPSSSLEKVCPSLKSTQTRHKLNSTVYPAYISSGTSTRGTQGLQASAKGSTYHAFTGLPTSKLICDFVPLLRLRMTTSVPQTGPPLPLHPRLPPLPPTLHQNSPSMMRSSPFPPFTTTADAGHVAPGTTDTGAFTSFVEVGMPKGETHHWTRLCSVLMEELVWNRVIIPQVDGTNRM